MNPKDDIIKKELEEFTDVPKEYIKTRYKHTDPKIEQMLKNYEDAYSLTTEILNVILMKIHTRIIELDNESRIHSEKIACLEHEIRKLKNTQQNFKPNQSNKQQ